MRSALAVALLLTCHPLAHADVVTGRENYSPAPSNCPAGSNAVGGGHGQSPHCSPSQCQSDTECPDGTGPCAPVGLCIATQPLGRMIGQAAVGACSELHPCTQGECVTIRRCTHAPAPPTTGCGCAIPGRSTPAASWLLLATLAWTRRQRVVHE